MTIVAPVVILRLLSLQEYCHVHIKEPIVLVACILLLDDMRYYLLSGLGEMYILQFLHIVMKEPVPVPSGHYLIRVEQDVGNSLILHKVPRQDGGYQM